MKAIAIVFITISSLYSNLFICQLDKTFPDSTGAWVNTDCFLGGPTYCNTFRYFLSGDTLLYGKEYTKVYSGGYHLQDTSSYFLTGLLRTDSLAVYFRKADQIGSLLIQGYELDTGDVLLYDFGLNIGDTFVNPWNMFEGPDTITLVSIDTSFIGIPHREFYFTGSNGYFTYWIEGIGSNWGLFPFYETFENIMYFHCFHDDTLDFAYDLAGGSDCYNLPIGISKEEELIFELSPNPINHQLNISTEFNEPYSIEIWDVYGQTLKRFDQRNGSTSIDLTSLKKGLLIARITAGSRTQTFKLLKQ